MADTIQDQAHRRDAIGLAIDYLCSRPTDDRHPLTLAEQLGDYILKARTPWPQPDEDRGDG